MAIRTPTPKQLRIDGCSEFYSSATDLSLVSEFSASVSESRSRSSISRHIPKAEPSLKMEIDVPQPILHAKGQNIENISKLIQGKENLNPISKPSEPVAIFPSIPKPSIKEPIQNLPKEEFFPSFPKSIQEDLFPPVLKASKEGKFQDLPLKEQRLPSYENPDKPTPEFKFSSSSVSSSVNSSTSKLKSSASSSEISKKLSLTLKDSNIKEHGFNPGSILASPINFKILSDADSRFVSSTRSVEKKFDELFKSAVKMQPSDNQGQQSAKKHLAEKGFHLRDELSGTSFESKELEDKINSLFNTTSKNKDLSDSFFSFQSKNDPSLYQNNNPSLSLFSSNSRTTSDPTESSRNSESFSPMTDLSQDISKYCLSTSTFISPFYTGEKLQPDNEKKSILDTSNQKKPLISSNSSKITDHDSDASWKSSETIDAHKSDFRKLEKERLVNFHKIREIDLYPPIKFFYGETYAKTEKGANIGVLRVPVVKSANIRDKKMRTIISQDQTALDTWHFPKSHRKFDFFDGYSLNILNRFENPIISLRVNEKSEYTSVTNDEVCLIMTDCFKDSVILKVEESKVYFNKHDIVSINSEKLFTIMNASKNQVTILIIKNRIIN